MSWGRVNHPSEVFQVGDEVQVKVLKYNAETERVSLGLKQTMEDPWNHASESYPQGKRVRGISAQAMALLAAYRWPGNVRQLENAVFRAVVLADGDEIGVDEFPQIASQVSSDVLAVQPLIEPSPAMVASWPEPERPVAGPTSAHSLPLTDPHGDVRPLDDIERDTIRFAISHYRDKCRRSRGGSVSGALPSIASWRGWVSMRKSRRNRRIGRRHRPKIPPGLWG